MSTGLAHRRAPSPRPSFITPSSKQGNSNSNIQNISKLTLLFISFGLILYAFIQQDRKLFPNEKPVTTPIEEIGYLIVGLKNNREFTKVVDLSWTIKDTNPSFNIRIFAIPEKERFASWITRFSEEYKLPHDFNHELVVIKLKEFVAWDFDSFRKHVCENGLWVCKQTNLQEQQPPQQQQIPQSIKEIKPITKKILEEEVGKLNKEDPIDNAANKDAMEEDEQQQQVQSKMDYSDGPYLPAQVTFKNKIITGYRASEDKKFTNYKPFAYSVVNEQGWQFIYQAPLMSSIILVQDQTSASISMVRYPRALINNIGWGGQACLGGTKGAQLQCRSNKAEQDGCNYEYLGIQPKQNRLWIAEECKDFFQEKCKDDQQLFIQKPSGGQHGAGMKVHQGCTKLKQEFELYCESEWPASKKKYLIMPYLQPALLDGHKFDVRTYALVASLDPLLVFYGDGFVRKATHKYSTENLNDATAHITNSMSQNAKDDHFWDFARLSSYLTEKHNFPKDFMFNEFREKAMKVTEFVFQAARFNMKKKTGRFQLFAADWIVDSEGGIHLLEVNSNPLVGTPYPGLEQHFPRIWNELMKLVIQIQTGFMPRQSLKKDTFVSGNWRLVLNELEETTPYNSCEAFRNQIDKKVTGTTPIPQTLEQVEKNFAKEVQDEIDIETEEDIENVQASGGNVDFEDFGKFIMVSQLENFNLLTRISPSIPCPSQQKIDDIRKKCILAPGSEDETVYHVLDSYVPGPIVVILAGVHGNEGAGVVAARYIARYWTPSTGIIVVFERANVRGVAANLRFVPASHSSPAYDLNRVFGSDTNTRFLANAIWEFMNEAKPDLFFDLHEGRNFFASSSSSIPDDVEQVIENVGSTTGGKISKGNSVVSSANAEPLARVVADACNQIVQEQGRKFLVMVPPIAGGLAAKVSAAFDTKVLLFETTLVFPLETRAKQHLFMVSVALRAAGALPLDFDSSVHAVETCVVTRKGCHVAT